MASLIKRPKGHKWIQFIAPATDTRKTLRLGSMSVKDATTIRLKVESILAARTSGLPIDASTAEWVGKLEGELSRKLARLGLIQGKDVRLLGEFLDAYFASRTDVKKGTKKMWGHTKWALLEFFGADKALSEITEGDAEDWRRWLLAKGSRESKPLSKQTVARRSGMAKQFFGAAVKKRLIAVNPFATLKATVNGNPDRFYYVTRDEIDRVLAFCPDVQWRTIFALCRFGGLRCPSEVLSLRWEHIHWELGRMTVLSPKTEHHDGGASREIPLFPELRDGLNDAWDQAEEGAEYVITRYRSTEANLRTQAHKIIRRAGLEPWPKVFQNMRSTRQTELSGEHPDDAVCKWMGNSQKIATKHYLQVTDEHFAKAIARGGPEGEAKSEAQVKHK